MLRRGDVRGHSRSASSARPRAARHEYVPQMLSLIERLEAKGLAYRADNGDVNYAVRKFGGYGKLSAARASMTCAPASVSPSMATKQDPLDFRALEGAKPDEPAMPSGTAPMVPGRPGWHIECSAMSCAVLGEQFDIHGGGMDLQFPTTRTRSPRARAPTGCRSPATGCTTASSTSTTRRCPSPGQFLHHPRRAGQVRRRDAALLHAAHALPQPFNFSDSHLEDARVALTRSTRARRRAARPLVQIDWTQGPAADFKAAMDEDFGTPGPWPCSSIWQRGQSHRSARASRVAQGAGRGARHPSGDPRAYLQGGGGADEGLDRGAHRRPRRRQGRATLRGRPPSAPN